MMVLEARRFFILREEDADMGSKTKIYDKFTHYSLEDCNCIYCLYYKGKRNGCSRDECCCSVEKAIALVHEATPQPLPYGVPA